MVKKIKYITWFVCVCGLCMFYFGDDKVHGFIYRHWYVWDKLCYLLFSIVIWVTSKGFARYAYCALSAFMALRLYWGILEEMNAETANTDTVLKPIYAMLIIITFGVITAAAEWKIRQPKTS